MKSAATKKRKNAERTGWRCGKKPYRSVVSSSISRRRLVHVLDIRLKDEQVGLPFAVDLQAGLVIPLDHALQHLAIFQDEDHGRLGLHLLHVVEILGVCLIRGSGFLLMVGAAIYLVLHFVQGRTYQF